jgi:phage tail-like protein
MRAGVPGLPTPHPIGERLPGVFLDDDFSQRFVSGLDEVLAPLFLTLDSFPAYLDPKLTPEDFLGWLSQWVAFPLDESWPVELRRELVSNAVGLHRKRGTLEALKRQVELLTGGQVEVADSGSTRWSEQAGEEIPGPDAPEVTVRVRAPGDRSVDATALRTAVVEAVPAHVRVTVEIE